MLCSRLSMVASSSNPNPNPNPKPNPKPNPNPNQVIELDPERFDHPFYFGLQGHPEYRSRPLAPSPPFLAFVRAAGRKGRPGR